MTGTRLSLALVAAGAFASLAAFAGAGPSGASPSGYAGTRCEIATSNPGGGTLIEGRIDARHAVSGQYTLSVSGPGTNIRQGGEFDARAGETVTLGSVRLGGSARAYDVQLEVTEGGRTIHCTGPTML